MTGLDTELEHLVRGANRIGAFFAAMPDEAEARASIAEHVQRFWAPALQRQLFAYVDQGGTGLDPLVQQALHLLRR